MKLILLMLLSFPLTTIAQKVGDNTITVKLSDTVNIYEQARIALVKSEFVVKDLGVSDTLYTYVKDLGGIPGQMIVRAVVNNSNITFNGIYSLKRLNDWGFYKETKNYKPVIYFKGSKSWSTMVNVINYLKGEVIYSETKLEK